MARGSSHAWACPCRDLCVEANATPVRSRLGAGRFWFASGGGRLLAQSVGSPPRTDETFRGSEVRRSILWLRPRGRTNRVYVRLVWCHILGVWGRNRRSFALLKLYVRCGGADKCFMRARIG